MNTKSVLAWHFINGDKLRDGNPAAPAGVSERFNGSVVMCLSGLHASVRPIDALTFAPGSTIRRVECTEIAQIAHDKLVCRERRVLWSADATRTLHEFACWCLTILLDHEGLLGITISPLTRKAIKTKLDWLDGKASEKEMNDAWMAARAASSTFVWYTELNDSAQNAARSAMGSIWPVLSRSALNDELERRLSALEPTSVS